MSFLDLKDKNILVCGVANRKSVAYAIGQVLHEAGVNVCYSVRSEERKEQLQPLLGEAPVFVCDVEDEEQIQQLQRDVADQVPVLHGLVHSIAFADYQGGVKPFHETDKAQFLRAVDVSCFSLLALSKSLQSLLDPDASVVTISISTTRMASENYGRFSLSRLAAFPGFALMPSLPDCSRHQLRQGFLAMLIPTCLPKMSFPENRPWKPPRLPMWLLSC